MLKLLIARKENREERERKRMFPTGGVGQIITPFSEIFGSDVGIGHWALNIKYL